MDNDFQRGRVQPGRPQQVRPMRPRPLMDVRPQLSTSQPFKPSPPKPAPALVQGNVPQMQPAVEQPYSEPEQPAQEAAYAEKPKSTGKTVLIVILLALLLIGVGAGGYLFKKNQDKLSSQAQKLAAASQALRDDEAELAASQAEKDFVLKNNTENLSKALCGGKPLAMYDVHLNSSYGVFRFLCAEQANPIRIGALKKLEDGTYVSTYSSTDSKRLPSYIYDTDADFFGKTYGATKF